MELSINWDEDVRCIIISKEFSDWDKVLLEYLNISIELYNYKYFEDNTFDLIPAIELQDSIKHQRKIRQNLPQTKKKIQDNKEKNP